MNYVHKVYDIEVYPNLFLYVDKDIQTKEINVFEISEIRNDYSALIDYLKSLKGNIQYHIGFNNLNYDYPIIHDLIVSDKSNYSSELLCEHIYSLSKRIIETQNVLDRYSFITVPEWKQILPQLDLYKLWHFDNKAKRVGLKWIQYMLDWGNLQDLPFKPHEKIAVNQIDNVIKYCINDVESTVAFYKLTKGENIPNDALKDYKDKNKLQLREDIGEVIGVNLINFNDVKIGETLIKNDYCRINNIDKRDLKPVYHPIDFTFGDCFPDNYEFKTSVFQKFIDSFKNVKVSLEDDEQEFKLKINQTTYVIARGGIHSEDSPRIIKPTKDEILRDSDVGSQYPNGIRKRKLYPRHLKSNWLENYEFYISERLRAKQLYKEIKNPKYKSFDELFKLSLNGGSFGKLGEKTNWQYDPFTQMKVTIGNQIEILMLIEKLEDHDIKVLSANTDGILSIFEKKREHVFKNICDWWEKKVGNHEMGKLEFVDYKLFAQTSVNDYLAIGVDDKVKKKGDFLTEFEIHKNKSKRVVALALEQYFVNGIKPEDFIPKHQNIFDFCLAIKGDKEAKYYTLNLKTNEKKYLQKINRFYISNTDDILVKELLPNENKKPTYQIDIFGEVDDGTRLTRIEAGNNVKIFNQYIYKSDYNINYNYYIIKTYQIIKQILNE